jgi:hypothetical protein
VKESAIAARLTAYTSAATTAREYRPTTPDENGSRQTKKRTTRFSHSSQTSTSTSCPKSW